jgi:hypothetical protein
VSAFTFGSLTDGEGAAASLVAEALDCTYQIRLQSVIADPFKAAARSNFITDGLGIGFAHQFNFKYELSFTRWRPSFHGHGHLLRGGFARTMAGGAAYLESAVRSSFLSPFTTQAGHDLVLPTIDAWKSKRSVDFRDGRDVLLYAQLDHRLGIFTAPSSLDLMAQTIMVYPLLDERIARFASSLSAFDRVSERVVFGAMRHLAPELADLPLFGEIWRFDRSPDLRDFPDSDHNFQDGYLKRQPRQADKLANLNIPTMSLTYDADRGEVTGSPKAMAAAVLSSSLRPEFMELVSSETMTEIEHLAATGQYTATYRSFDANKRFTMDSFIRRCFVAATLYDMHW